VDIFFQDPNEIRLPPDEVRIRDLRAQTLPDGRRVHVYLEVDPFQKRPSAELTISDVAGNRLATASVIESMTRKMELTMHLRGREASVEPTQEGGYTLQVVLFYLAPLPKPEEGDRAEVGEPKVVDRRDIQFESSS
jgi:hypothetical protein